jgi:hypothetical protein
MRRHAVGEGIQVADKCFGGEARSLQSCHVVFIAMQTLASRD